MGVPKFFRWLSERYPKINQPISCDPNPKTREKYFKEDDTPIDFVNEVNQAQIQGQNSDVIDPSIPEFDRLYIDMNGIIHGCSHNNSDQQQTLSSGSDDAVQIKQKEPITEEEIFANISYYLDRVISDIARPKELVYMAVDGVAPRAKMNQQRSRRFRSGKESEIAEIQRKKLEKERMQALDMELEMDRNEQNEEDRLIQEQLGWYDDEFNDDVSTGDAKKDLQKGPVSLEMKGDDLVTTSTGGFAGTIRTGKLKKNHEELHEEQATEYTNILADLGSKKSATKDSGEESADREKKGRPFHHNSITPGTPFLDRCSNHIQNFIRHKLTSGDPAWKDLKIIFSGPHVPGEGEHKIMDFIRKEQHLEGKNSKSQRKRHCLMGQDGDLIMLGLATHELNFCLLREKVHFGQQNNVPPIAESNASMNTTQSSIRQYTDNSNFQLLHMNVLRDYLAYEFETSDVVPTSPFDLEPTIDDFVFMTFFVGNDFLPHMPALDIGDGAFDLLFQKYKKHRAKWVNEGRNTKKKKKNQKASKKISDYPYFTRSGEIVNGGRLEKYLMDVGGHEDPYYEWKKSREDRAYENIRNADIKYGREFSVPSKEERELLESKNRLKYKSMLEDIAINSANDIDNGEKNKPVLSSKSLPSITFIPEAEEEDEDGLLSRFSSLISNSLSPTSQKKEDEHTGQFLVDDSDMTDLKGRYYSDKFNFSPLDNDKHQALRKAYIEGLMWNLKYYYHGCISWDWYYPYHYGPMLSDLKGIPSILKSVKFDLGKPFHPFEQLLACMPPNASHALPKPYRFLMTDKEMSPIVDYYPEDFDVDMNGKHTPWEAVVLLPFIDATKLMTTVEKLVDKDLLTEDEKRRNKFGKALMMSVERKNDLPKLKEDVYDEISSNQFPFQIPKYLNPDEEDEYAPIDNLLPGFTTLRSVPISALERKKLQINVFGTRSRYKTGVLNMETLSYSTLPPLQMLGKKFIGTTIFYQYPYFREGFVTSLSDSTGSIRGIGEYNSWESEREVADYKDTSDRLYREYEFGDSTVGSGGWHLPTEQFDGLGDERNINRKNEKIIITLRPLIGLEQLESGEIVKVYDKNETQVPFIAALWNPHRSDPRLFGIRAKLERDPYSSALRKYQNRERRNTSSSSDKLKSPQLPLGFGTPLSNLKASQGNPSLGLPPLSNKTITKSYTTFSRSVHIPDPWFQSFATRSQSFDTMNVRSSNVFRKSLEKRSYLSQQHLEVRKQRNLSYHSTALKLHKTGLGRAAVCLMVASTILGGNSHSFIPCAEAKLHSDINVLQSSKFVNAPFNDIVSSLHKALSVRCGDSNLDHHDSNERDTRIDDMSSPPPLEFAHGTTTLSFIFQGGIIAAVDSRASMGNFVGSKTTQKVLPITKHILGTMAGGAADCSFWIRKLQSYANLHSLATNHSISIARASRLLSDFLYQNRQLDLSVGTMIMGFDARGASIYYVDNTGLRIGGDLFSVGSGSTFALGILDTVNREERWEMTEKEAIELGIRAIRHATFRDAFSGGYIGVYLITKKNGWKKVFSEDLALMSGRS